MPELITPVGKNSAFLLYNRLCACVCEYYKIGYFYEVRDANGLLGRNDNGRRRIIRANKVQSERNCGSRRTTSKLKTKKRCLWVGRRGIVRNGPAPPNVLEGLGNGLPRLNLLFPGFACAFHADHEPDTLDRSVELDLGGPVE